jgi:hypothetical protein
MLGHQHKLGVASGSRGQRKSRAPREFCNRDDNREHGFEHFASSNTHVDSQILAAGRFDPPNFCRVEFGTRQFQHRRRVVSYRRVHCRTPHSSHDLIRDNADSQSRVAHGCHFVAASHDGTRINSLRQFTHHVEGSTSLVRRTSETKPGGSWHAAVRHLFANTVSASGCSLPQRREWLLREIGLGRHCVPNPARLVFCARRFCSPPLPRCRSYLAGEATHHLCLSGLFLTSTGLRHE